MIKERSIERKQKRKKERKKESEKKGRKKIEGEQFGIELKISAHLPFLWHDEAITFNLTITNRQTIDGQTDALADARKGHTLFRESMMGKMEKKR